MTQLPADLLTEFPRLCGDNYRVTSPEADEYNCVAWAMSDDSRWWQPGDPDGYWPLPVESHTGGLMAFVQSLVELGFIQGGEGPPKPGLLRVAIYSDRNNFFSHLARQLSDGWWASKLGPYHDIEHDTPDAVAGGRYGEVAGYLLRPLPPPG
jgi:hypothetical protein